ncbi:MAG: FISUMP domain-containing protein [Prevotella sp.]
MKKIFWTLILCAVALPVVTSCSDDDDLPTEVRPSSEGTFTDDDGSVYRTVKYGAQEWLAENYRGGEPWVEQSYLTDNGIEYWFEDDYDIDEEEELIASEGNYMTWQQAIDNCPEGWRLPTDEDWQQLERALGVADVEATGWRDGGGMPMMSASGLHLTLCGALHSRSTAAYEKCNVGDYGYYWTATLDPSVDAECAFIRKVVAGKNQVMRNSMPTRRYAMVRYVRDL